MGHGNVGALDSMIQPENPLPDVGARRSESGKDLSPGRFESAVSKQDILAALRGLEMDRLRAVLPPLGLFYFMYALQVSLFPPPLNHQLGGVALVTAATCGFLWFILQRRFAGPEWSPWLGFFAAAITLLNPFADLRLAGDPGATLHLMLVVVGLGFTVLSPACFASLAAVSLMGWLLVAFPYLPSPVWVSHGCVLVAGTLIAALIHGARLKVTRKSQRKYLENQRDRWEVEERRKRHELAVRGANDGLWCWDLDTGRLHVSLRWRSMLGYDGENFEEPDDWLNLIHPYDLPAFKKALTDHINGQTEFFESKHRMRDRDGVYRWALVRATASRDENGNAKYVAGSQTDITELINVESRLMHDALHDKLTGLPNRSFLMRQLETIRERKQLFAILFLDLDRFKIINDTLGHAAGDQLLVATAERLLSCKRTGDVVARLGGDEFVVVLNGLRGPEDAQTLAHRIQVCLEKPVELKGQQITSPPSIGIALSEGTSPPELLLRNADIAMYDAKASKGKISVFRNEMRGRVVNSWELQSAMRDAIERDEFFLRYQPLVSVADRRIAGVEALLRWRRPQGEVLSALQIIRHAEDLGLISEIGEWVLRTACTQNKQWQEAGLPPLCITVNVSTRQLRDQGFPKTVRRVLEETGLDAKWLALELTESALTEGEETAQASLLELSDYGVELCLDDFGIGYSSLEYLRRFPFTTLKIARNFVDGIPADQKSAALLEGLIGTARKLNLRVIAKGVENEQQLSFLVAHGCDWIQGFVASTPLHADELAGLLQSRQNILPKISALADSGNGRSEARLVPKTENVAVTLRTS